MGNDQTGTELQKTTSHARVNQQPTSRPIPRTYASRICHFRHRVHDPSKICQSIEPFSISKMPKLSARKTDDQKNGLTEQKVVDVAVDLNKNRSHRRAPFSLCQLLSLACSFEAMKIFWYLSPNLLLRKSHFIYLLD